MSQIKTTDIPSPSSKAVQTRTLPSSKLARFVVAFIFCLEILSGCAFVEIFQGETATEANQHANSSIFRISDRVVGDEISQIDAFNNFPVTAPGIKLPSPRLEVNHEVRRELANLLRANGRSISQSLKRQETLFPVLAKIFQDEGLPEELLNLALIESGFNTESRSPAGAVGIWQFMSSTARLYGLEVSHRVDERKDPILSTIAAARHLKDLYARFNDWYLVLAAYNAGEGAVTKAGSASHRLDYWSMVRAGRVQSETARFVPKFIAASILQKLYQHYGSDVQLAQYIDRHVVKDSVNGAKASYAFNLESDVLVRRG